MRKERVLKQMQEARSDELVLLEEPNIESLPGLAEDLDRLVEAGSPVIDEIGFVVDSGFAMTDYRCHILSALQCSSRFFSGITCLGPDPRKDRAFRFVTLIFMQQDCEVELTQHEDDILIERLIG